MDGIQRDHWARSSYPCVLGGSGEVKHAHTDYCIEYGHAIYTINGIVQDYCPRCGDLLS